MEGGMRMPDREKVRKGLEWILDGDRFGFGENWHIDSEPKTEEEQAGYYIQRAIAMLKEQQQKKGHWLDDGDPCAWVCSVCGYGVSRHNNTPFCPNCGADMRKGGEVNDT